MCCVTRAQNRGPQGSPCRTPDLDHSRPLSGGASGSHSCLVCVRVYWGLPNTRRESTFREIVIEILKTEISAVFVGPKSISGAFRRNHAPCSSIKHVQTIATKLVLLVTEQNLDNLNNCNPPCHHPESPRNPTLKFSRLAKLFAL
jgi:hypothetical protein